MTQTREPSSKQTKAVRPWLHLLLLPIAASAPLILLTLGSFALLRFGFPIDVKGGVSPNVEASQEQVDKLKADLKADLIGQISFPVVFAIASIFAAFAVKDIVIEVLKKEEKDKLIEDLKAERDSHINEVRGNLTKGLSDIKSNLSSDLKEDFRRFCRDEVSNKMRDIPLRLGRLEYETASLTALQHPPTLSPENSWQAKFSSNLTLDLNIRTIEILQNLIQQHPEDPTLKFALRCELEEFSKKFHGSNSLQKNVAEKIEKLKTDLQGDKEAYDVGEELLKGIRNSIESIFEIKMYWLYALLENSVATSSNPDSKQKLIDLQAEILSLNNPVSGTLRRMKNQKIADEADRKDYEPRQQRFDSLQPAPRDLDSNIDS
jgi:hypothetical protein